MPIQFHLLLLASALVLVTGCMSTNVANSEQIELNAMARASNADITPIDAIRQASAAYEEAIAAELQFYAPSHMESCRAHLSSVRMHVSRKKRLLRSVQLLPLKS